MEPGAGRYEDGSATIPPYVADPTSCGRAKVALGNLRVTHLTLALGCARCVTWQPGLTCRNESEATRPCADTREFRHVPIHHIAPLEGRDRCIRGGCARDRRP